MLAGLGQIHVVGDVKVYQLPAKTKAGEFTVKKTFAWGGIYGGVTAMKTVEQGIAEGIAAAVTGQAESDSAGKPAVGTTETSGSSVHS